MLSIKLFVTSIETLSTFKKKVFYVLAVFLGFTVSMNSWPYFAKQRHCSVKLAFSGRSALVNELSNIGQKASVGIKLGLCKLPTLVSLFRIYRFFENP